MDSCTSAPAQRTVTAFRACGHLKPHLQSVLELYRDSRNAMRASLQGRFGDEVSTTHPYGGYFLGATFNDERVDAQELFEALSEGVASIPDSASSTQGNFGSVRSRFATSTRERIEERVARLQRAANVSGFET